MNTNKFFSWCKQNYIFFILLLALITAANLFLWQFYAQEKYIYFWDWSAYQSHFIFIVGKLNKGIFPAIGALLYSIAFTEYSLLAPLVIAPLGLIFGTTRGVFLFSVLNVFAIPAALLLGAVFKKATSKNNWLWILLPAVILLLTPQFWIPLLLGWFDVATLITICVIWLLLLSEDQTKSKSFWVGILLTSLIFTRRWFGYWSVAFFPAITLLWIYAKFSKQKPFWDLTKIVICGLAALGFLLILGEPIARVMISQNYGQMFSAFKAGNSTWQVILAACYHYGWLSLIFAGLGFAWALWDKKIKNFVLIIFFQTLITLILFARVQLIDQHHHYQFLIALVLFQSLFLYYLWESKIHRVIKFLASVIFFLVLIANFLQSLVPQSHLNFQIAHLTPTAKHYPLKRDDLAVVNNLVAYLNEQMPEGSTLYVTSSSLVLNDDVIRNSCRYLNLNYFEVCKNVIFSSNVDLRDGFPWQFTQADYILVTVPEQYHLRPVDQRVIIVLNQMLLNKSSLGAAYQELPNTFTLDGGVSVKVLKKNRELTDQELQSVSQAFLKFYPGREDLFEIPKPVLPENFKKPGKLELIKAKIKKILGGSDVSGETSY